MSTTGRRNAHLTLTISLILAACSANGPLFQDAPAPPAGQALIYIYREENGAFSARSAIFYVDNVDVAELNNDGYTWLYVPAGSHVLSQKFSLDLVQTLHVRAYWEPGKTYYYKFGTDLSYNMNYNVFHWHIAQTDDEQARSEIGRYHYQPSSR